jgi:hypothetical protein
LLKWGLGCLLELAAKGFGAAVTDPRLPMWKDMAARLTPYQTDEATGFLIGADTPLAHGHRQVTFGDGDGQPFETIFGVVDLLNFLLSSH